MREIQTLRLRPEFAEELLERSGGQRGVARRLGLSLATVNRQLNHNMEPSARFVAKVLTVCAVRFEDAFMVSDEPVETLHRGHQMKPSAGMNRSGELAQVATKVRS